MSSERVVQLIELERILYMNNQRTTSPLYNRPVHDRDPTSDLFSLKHFSDAFVTCYEVLHYSLKKSTSLPG